MAYAGTWKFSKQENMDKFLASTGMPADKAKETASTDSTIVCGKDGDMYFIKETIKGKVYESKFKMGVPFKLDVAFLGLNETVTATEEGDKLIVKGSLTETREIQGNTLIITLTKDGIAGNGKRYYNKC
ncbi:fatty acid-binding protein, intestinal-like [Glandiceps talaboti]